MKSWQSEADFAEKTKAETNEVHPAPVFKLDLIDSATAWAHFHYSLGWSA